MEQPHESTVDKAETSKRTNTTGSTHNLSSSENIQVFIRIRPLIGRETSDGRVGAAHSLRAVDQRTIEVRTNESAITCKYDAVFDSSATQEQVYERVRECTAAFLSGFNATLFAYGQTGSGKSFTMFGDESDGSRFRPGLHKSQAGVIPRAIKEIFAGIVQMESQAQAMVYCSFVQIYNEQIFDLLRDGSMDRPLEIHEDRRNGIYVDGLSEYAVRSVNDCLSLLQCGEQHRAVRSTHMNQVSSRSHSVFQLLLEQKRNDGTMIKSKLNLVDLAGSEKWNADNSMVDSHISEMTNINLSLHTLGRCIAALSIRNGSSKTHVPYRDSKLTRLLQDSLGGNTKTKIIATLSPSLDCIEESISTLKFADRAKQVMVTARVNEQREIDPAYVEKLQQEITRLRDLVKNMEGRPRNSHVNDDNNAAAHEDEPQSSSIQAQLVQLIQENSDLKAQVEKQQREIADLRQGKAVDHSVVQAKQQLEATLCQLRDASDRFFRFEIEEDELKTIHEHAFRDCGLSATKHTAMKPRPPKSASPTTSVFSPIHSPGSIKNSTSTPVDLAYRVRGRSTSASGGPVANNNGEEWKNDATQKPAFNPEKELQLSRKAIAKQAKLQAWLIEKEKRELLKLQQEQEFIEEQRRLMAEKDAKFLKHAAATKKKLQLLQQQQKQAPPTKDE